MWCLTKAREGHPHPADSAIAYVAETSTTNIPREQGSPVGYKHETSPFGQNEHMHLRIVQILSLSRIVI
jgi:hypothetical protein